MAPSMKPGFALESGVPLLRCRLFGEIDSPYIPALETPLRNWLEHHAGVLLMDLREVSYLDAATLHLLERLHQVAAARGAELVLLLSPFHEKLLRIVGLHRALRVASRGLGGGSPAPGSGRGARTSLSPLLPDEAWWAAPA